MEKAQEEVLIGRVLADELFAEKVGTWLMQHSRHLGTAFFDHSASLTMTRELGRASVFYFWPDCMQVSYGGRDKPVREAQVVSVFL